MVICNVAALIAGLTDIFRKGAGFTFVREQAQHRWVPRLWPGGPAARLESSKVFSKSLTTIDDILPARRRSLTSAGAAEAYMNDDTHRVVVKAIGVCDGRGCYTSPSLEVER